MQSIHQIMKKIEAIESEVERSQEYSDLAYDGEVLAEEGKLDEAREIFLELNKLDKDNDLFDPARQAAEAFLRKSGDITATTTSKKEKQLLDQFGRLDPYNMYIAVASNLGTMLSSSKKDIL